MKQLQIKCWSVFIILFVAGYAYAASPVNVLEQAANRVIKSLKQNKANLRNNPKYVYRVVNRYIIPLVDVRGMSRSVLGRNAWVKASASERGQFTRQFTRLVVRTYSGALRDYSGEKIKFMPIRGGYRGKRFVKVSSVIIKPSGQNIPLRYSLVRKSSGWMVYDMSVEGVSLLQSYRSQFKQELNRGTLAQLNTKLKRKNKGGY